jgi:hypothetical protein
MRAAMQKRRIVPKVRAAEALPGSLHAVYKRCGTAGCRCAQGALHGPYWRHQWREGGRTRRRYVRQADVAAVRASLAAWREVHPPLGALRQRLTAIRRLVRLLGV